MFLGFEQHEQNFNTLWTSGSVTEHILARI